MRVWYVRWADAKPYCWPQVSVARAWLTCTRSASVFHLRSRPPIKCEQAFWNTAIWLDCKYFAAWNKTGYRLETRPLARVLRSGSAQLLICMIQDRRARATLSWDTQCGMWIHSAFSCPKDSVTTNTQLRMWSTWESTLYRPSAFKKFIQENDSEVIAVTLDCCLLPFVAWPST